MLTRRDFLKAMSGIAALGPAACALRAPSESTAAVNDIHSQLNHTRVNRIVRPPSVEAVQSAVRAARAERRGVSIAGGMHAMGGQQFGAETILVDMRGMNRVLSFDSERGQIEVEAGIEWPELVDYLLKTQSGRTRQWSIVQKQTGADRLSLGGALSANVHGRGLNLKPIVGDIESFTLVDANGKLLACNRRENAELFRLAIGGYGLFGVIASIKLRLAPRRKIERVVEVLDLEDLIPVFQQRIADGSLYGDFQYMTDPGSEGLLRRGVASRYRPVADSTPVPENQKELSVDDWRELLYLAHADKRKAFEVYSRYYLSTSGQTYWSDTHQMSTYIDNYHEALDKRLGSSGKSTEMITEIYVPRSELARFLAEVRNDVRENAVNIIFGTLRLIEKDEESFLAWAKERYVCIIFNLHVVHTPSGIEKAAADFRRLIERAIRRGGSYYLTYHRWATRAQVETCYPQLPEFLRLKKKYDPEERFQSEWYRHYRAMFADKL